MVIDLLILFVGLCLDSLGRVLALVRLDIVQLIKVGLHLYTSNKLTLTSLILF